VKWDIATRVKHKQYIRATVGLARETLFPDVEKEELDTPCCSNVETNLIIRSHIKISLL